MSNQANIKFRQNRPTVFAATGDEWQLVHGRVFNPVNYGLSVTADATTNTTAIQSAINDAAAAGGGIVDIPAGTFFVNINTIVLDTLSNIFIRGHNRYQSILKHAGPPATIWYPDVAGGGGFFRCKDCTNVHISSLGFVGAYVWSTAQSVIGQDAAFRQGIYWQSSAKGTTNCSVTDCYFNAIESESVYADGSTAHPIRGLHIDRNHFYQVSSNAVNVGVGQRLAAFNVTGDENLIEDCGGSPCQMTGTGWSFSRNMISMPSGYWTSSTQIIVVNSTACKIEDNILRDVSAKFSGVALVDVGFSFDEGTSVVSVRRNQFSNCNVIGAGVGSIILVRSESATYTKGVVIADNHLFSCGDANASIPGSIGIRLRGAGTIGAVVSNNTIDNNGRVDGIGDGVYIDGTVPGGNALTIQQHNNGATRPYTFNVAPLSDQTYVSGSKTWDPASVASGAQTTTTVTVTGAAVGDLVAAGFSLDLQGMQLTGYVSAGNTVTVVLRNGTAVPLDLGSGTLRARCFKS